MSEIRIQPSTTLVKVTYLIAILLILGIWLGGSALFPAAPPWYLLAMIIPLYLLIRAVTRHVVCNLTRLETSGDRLKYESGLFSKVSRSMPLNKVQDVTVSQSFGQRLLGLGDLSIETAGEQGGLVIREINSPRNAAEEILNRVAQAGGQAHSIEKK